MPPISSGGITKLISFGRQDLYLTSNPQVISKYHELCHFNKVKMNCTFDQRMHSIQTIYNFARNARSTRGGVWLGVLLPELMEMILDLLKHSEHTTETFTA